MINVVVAIFRKNSQPKHHITKFKKIEGIEKTILKSSIHKSFYCIVFNLSISIALLTA